MSGAALLIQSKLAAAEGPLLAGYEGMKKREETIPAQGRPRLADAAARLESLYSSWHAAEPDKGYGAKAAEWKAKAEALKH